MTAPQRLLVAQVSAFLLCLTKAHPSCYPGDATYNCYYFCEAFTSARHFAMIDRYRARNCAHFVLKDSYLDRLPPNAFADTSVSVLQFSNVTVGAYGDQQKNATSPFDALKHHLRKLIFSDQPRALGSWSLLRGLDRLETLLLLNVREVNLTTDFNSLPPSVKEIQILGAHIGRVDEDWLTTLHGLNAVMVKETNLWSISRSMLPRPAPRLMIIDLAPTAFIRSGTVSAFPLGTRQSDDAEGDSSAYEKLSTTMADYAGKAPLLHAVMFFATVLSWVSAEPFCLEIDGHKYRRIICREFESPDDFQKHVPRSESPKDTWFLLIDSAMDRLPPAAFAGLNVSELVLSNVVLSSLDAPEGGEGPLSGLETSLQKMVFRRDSTLPSSWSQLGNMTALRELHLQRYPNLNLTRDFGKLPASLKLVFVFDSSVNRVDDDWLVDLTNLETVIVRVTNLAVFTRSMLPNPAPRLSTLDLAENQLAAFPRGIGEDLPALQFVNLEDNRITTLDEKEVAPLHRDTVLLRLIVNQSTQPKVKLLNPIREERRGRLLDSPSARSDAFGYHQRIVFPSRRDVLAGNPMYCDCRLWFLLDYTDRWHYFLCQAPEIHRGRYIKMLSEPELPCGYGPAPELGIVDESSPPAANASQPPTQVTPSQNASASSTA
ncbi:hypothetical protein HPB51_022424 [Rhipicephalus microplus]|uniref:Uncharacterized protein n=1 Tax=Rhipicephalus microplus TaxID=6941 RepID=A0A9J6DQT5_RHIMP|nr:hypothetical protein HPB51_022424 [Rhipicephalus microplus]